MDIVKSGKRIVKVLSQHLTLITHQYFQLNYNEPFLKILSIQLPFLQKKKKITQMKNGTKR